MARCAPSSEPGSSRVARLVLASAGLCTCLATQARAEEIVHGSRVRLLVADGVEGCPTEAELAVRLRATEAETGRTAEPQGFSPAEVTQELEVVVTVLREEEGLVARVDVAGQRSGQRELRATNCVGLADALVVLVGMVIEEERVARVETSRAATPPPSPSPSPSPSGPERPVAPVEAPTEPTAEPPLPPASLVPAPAPPLDLSLLVSGGVSSDFAESLLAGAAFGIPHWSLRAQAWWRLPQNANLAPGRIESRIVGGTLAGCRTYGAAWRAVACAHWWTGALHVAARDFTRGREYDRPWLAAGASVGIETGRELRLGVEGVGLVPVLRDVFHVENVGSWDAGRPVGWLLTRVALQIF